MIEITSVNNDMVKEVVKLHQRKYRDESKKFLIEGFKAIEEAFLSKIEFEQVFVLKEKDEKYTFLKSEDIILTTEPVLKKISTTDSPPDAVAIAKQRIFGVDDIINCTKIMLLEGIKDAGNLGTILRTASAFSQDAVILFGDTVDLYNPKSVRSSVGNLWKIPVVQLKDFKELEVNFASFSRIATLPKFNDTVLLNQFKLKTPYILMFGSESDGLSEELINFSTQKVSIEMHENVESLNLSVSVGIALYHFSLK